MQKIIILGSTGSIGTQALSIIKEFHDIQVIGLSAGHNLSLLKAQILEFNPSFVSTIDRSFELEKEFPNIIFYYGKNALTRMVKIKEDAMVLNSLVGSVGLVPTLEAIKTHKKVLLSNKETLVIGGEIVYKYLYKYKGTLYPIDSEHSALWELIDKYGKDNIDSLTITASGGPFRDYSLEDLKNVSKEDALSHPNWKMGEKITIDSATMMNKGFELIEAHYLFQFPMEKIHAVINRSSTIHAMVTLKDGTTHFESSIASMRNPIIRALYYPHIRYTNVAPSVKDETFYPIDELRYPLMYKAYEAMRKGGLYPTILNASNEAAVQLFLENKITFEMIDKIISEALTIINPPKVLSIKYILKCDKIVKNWALNKYSKEK